ncbi:hypothetical protein G9A89_008300 [Geosiphon pyriformis]|nr:hypothetical protein G9A89_008300 [Geosiphon pyriformis]
MLLDNIKILAIQFSGVKVFSSGMDSEHCGSGVAIILNDNLAHYVCKISEVPRHLISVRLLFAGKASVMILGLYAGVLAGIRFEQTPAVNVLIASFISSSSHVLLSGDFNENRARVSKNAQIWDYSMHFQQVLGIEKTIDFIFVSNHLSSAVFGGCVSGVLDYFDTDHLAVLILKCFNECVTANMLLLRDDFTTAKDLSNLNTMWKLLEKVLMKSADSIFSKHWYIKALSVSNSLRIAHFVKIWSVLDDVESSKISGLLDTCSNSAEVFKQLSVVKKHYHKAKYIKSELAKSASINRAISKYIDDFVLGKENMISSILECFFRKVVLDYLVLDGNLILEPAEIKAKVNNIMVNWTRKCKYASLNYVVDNTFSGVMNEIRLGDLCNIVKNLPDGKAAGLLGHSSDIVLGCLLNLLNSCLVHKDVPALWKCAWISMIPKLYKWEGCLTNIWPIVLIETARKILSKILSDRISAAYNIFDVLRSDNFLVLRGISTQLPVFVIGSIIEDALEKDRELWLVLQDMWKAYNSVGWFHLRFSLRTNRIMTDFGLSDGYKVLNGLDQGKRIFYDPLLCKIKSQEHLCEYRIDSRLVAKSGRVESQAGMTSFFVVGAFFFAFNDIFINTEKTVTIPFNQRVKDIFLTISGTPIAVAKKGESHHYLGIFLSTEGLSKPSLLKAHLDVHFFSNVFSFVSSAVCSRWDAIIRRDLKFKTHLSCDFSMVTLLHLLFYGIKTFVQIQSESKLSSIINFMNALGILGQLFIHRSLDLQVASWLSVHSLCHPIRLWVNPKDNFLAGIVKIFSFCELSFSILSTAFHRSIGMPISEVLGNSVFFGVVHSLKHYGITFIDQLLTKKGKCFDWKCFKYWKQLNPRGPVPVWFDLAIHFLGAHLLAANIRLCMSIDYPECSVVASTISKAQNILLNSGLVLFNVYTDSSIKQFGSCSVVAGTVAFFPEFGLGVGARVQGVMSSTLAELKAIALILTCVSLGSSVFIYSDSQAVLSACSNELFLAHLNFQKNLWMEYRQIINFIRRKSLAMTWLKVKGHSGILGNMCFFLKLGDLVLSYNVRHYIKDFFYTLYCANWENEFGSKINNTCNINSVDWKRTFAVWHPNGYMTSGYMSHQLATLSVMCVFYDMIDTSEHSFVCLSDMLACNEILSEFCVRWSSLPNVTISSSMMVHDLFFGVSDVEFYSMLAKDFMLSGWYRETLDALGCFVVAGVIVIDFVRDLASSHRSVIWYKRSSHQLSMEKTGKIIANSSVSHLVDIVRDRLSVGVVRLLSLDKTRGVYSGMHTSCQIFSGMRDIVLVVADL